MQTPTSKLLVSCLICILLCVSITSCYEPGGIPDEISGLNTSYKIVNGVDCTEHEKPNLAELAEKMRAELPSETTISSFTIKPAKPSTTSRGKRILLLDENVVAASALRFSNRSIGYLKAAADGSYQHFEPVINVNDKVQAFLDELARKGRDTPYPCFDFSDLLYEIDRLTVPEFAGHGMDILPNLMSYIPEAEFVVSDDTLSDTFSKADFCSLDRSQASNQQIVDKLAAAGESLVEVIRDHELDYLHISWGLTDKLLDDMHEQCNHSPAVVELHKPIIMQAHLDLLTTISESGITIVQAGANPSIPIDPAKYVMDCTQIPNRFITGVASYLDFNVPAEGTTDKTLLTQNSVNAAPCTDLYIVSGYYSLYSGDFREPYLGSAPLGLGLLKSPSWPSSTSMTNPIALAYFIWWRDQNPGRSLKAFIKERNLSNRVFIVDPLQHRQYPLQQN